MAGNISWKLFTKSSDAWDAMLQSCSNAKVSIDLEQYIFKNDIIGTRFLEVLIKKYKEGVKVRILCDTAGSYSFYTSPIPEELIALGIEVRFFNIISPWRIQNFSSWFFRDHRKILVVDGEIGFTGGVGIIDSMATWRDTHVRVSGPIVLEMSKSFDEMWRQTKEKSMIARIKRGRKSKKGSYFLTNAPYFYRHFLYKEIISSINSSRKYVYLTTPYLIPSHKLFRALEVATKNGVDVRVLVPKFSNIPIVDRASRSYFDKILRIGVRIFRYDKENLHAKTIVIDDLWSTVGSFNLDNLSFLYNYEANIVSKNTLLAEELKEHFVSDTDGAEELTLPEWRKRFFYSKWREILTFPFRRFL